VDAPVRRVRAAEAHGWVGLRLDVVGVGLAAAARLHDDAPVVEAHGLPPPPPDQRDGRADGGHDGREGDGLGLGHRGEGSQ